MNIVFRNPALQYLLARTGGAMGGGLRESPCSADGCCMASEPGALDVWFPEQGAAVLEQRMGAHAVAVALLDAHSSPVVPLHDGLQIKPLSDGKGYRLPLDGLMALCPELLWMFQHKLQQQMAGWSGCMQHHALQARLAGTLLWLHRSCPQAVGWPVSMLPGMDQLQAEEQEPVIRALESVGAVLCQGGRLQVLEPDLLKDLACVCLVPGAEGGGLDQRMDRHRSATASATLMPSTPADRMPPA